MLSIVVDTLCTSNIPDVLIVPVGIAYDRIIEGNYNSEQLVRTHTHTHTHTSTHTHTHRINSVCNTHFLPLSCSLLFSFLLSSPLLFFSLLCSLLSSPFLFSSLLSSSPLGLLLCLMR